VSEKAAVKKGKRRTTTIREEEGWMARGQTDQER